MTSRRSGLDQAFLARSSPRLPRHDGIEASTAFGIVSLLVHAALVTIVLTLAAASSARGRDIASHSLRSTAEGPRLVFLVQPARPLPGSGGGGGGSRERRPATRAQAPGRDALTLPIATPLTPPIQALDEASTPQEVALDDESLASALAFQVGALDGPPIPGASPGPGTGGGVGDGAGTGAGSGKGPGVGPGSGGGIGGGVYRPGGGVTPPTLLLQVGPSYTGDAMSARIQGSVLLELVVQRDGTPREVRVVRSLDRDLDREAVLAVEQWRFSPGRLNGVPVDVLVTIVMDFRIH